MSGLEPEQFLQFSFRLVELPENLEDPFVNELRKVCAGSLEDPLVDELGNILGPLVSFKVVHVIILIRYLDMVRS